ncbi:hypothetical protein AGMMS49525_04780 [Bacteroidia bacterium]|nr:hypothetical protein AGMMS49525_04780 [Bacteroidia bacterium]
MELRVLEICRSKGITQKKLAEMIEMSPVGMSKAINGNPTMNTLEKIASALNVPITELFDEKKEVSIWAEYKGEKKMITERDLIRLFE